MGTAVLASLLILVSPAQAKPSDKDGKKQPDLTAKSVSSDRPFIVRGRPNETIELRSRTENRGKADAGASKTRYILKSTSSPVVVLRTFQGVPKLDAGKEKDGKKKGALTGDEVAINEYQLTACADAKKQVDESNEKNNCRKGGIVTVVPWKLIGEVTGEYFLPLAGFTESWTANSVTFETTPGQTAPNYFPTTGLLDYVASGEDAFGCTYSGGGQIPLDPIEGILTLALDLNSYSVLGTLGMDREYTYTVSCPNQDPGPSTGPSNREWLRTEVQPTGRFGRFPDSLTGGVQFFNPDGERLTYTWNLRVE